MPSVAVAASLFAVLVALQAGNAQSPGPVFRAVARACQVPPIAASADVPRDNPTATSANRRAKSQDYDPDQHTFSGLGVLVRSEQTSDNCASAADDGTAEVDLSLATMSVTAAGRPGSAALVTVADGIFSAATGISVPVPKVIGSRRLRLADADPSMTEMAAKRFPGFAKDVEGGAAWAQDEVAIGYMTGVKGPIDYTAARMWFLKAAEQGSGEADVELGIIYFKGLGVPPNHQMARSWFLQASSSQPKAMMSAFLSDQQIHGIAEGMLGAMYEEGDAVPIDLAEARRWFTKAAIHDQPLAQFEVGKMWHEGEGGPRDYVEAKKWYLAAARNGQAIAQNNLGVMLELGEGGPQNFTEAIFWYRKAAAQGYGLAQLHMGGVYYYGHGVARDFAAAREWFLKAASQDVPLAEAMLGVLYLKGNGVPQNYAVAQRWLHMASDHGLSEAQFLIGVLYDQGLGQPADREEGLIWLRKAAGQGNADAQWYLRLMAQADRDKARRGYQRPRAPGVALPGPTFSLCNKLVYGSYFSWGGLMGLCN